eukprot:Pompholyxophrys_punicea_v1_NODE_1_length_14747_cov_12.267901.p14 type:complete len:108 gc:universal NODE_1_length_14747_cov_12.267901:1088-1411(+)
MAAFSAGVLGTTCGATTRCGPRITTGAGAVAIGKVTASRINTRLSSEKRSIVSARFSTFMDFLDETRHLAPMKLKNENIRYFFSSISNLIEIWDAGQISGVSTTLHS